MDPGQALSFRSPVQHALHQTHPYRPDPYQSLPILFDTHQGLGLFRDQYEPWTQRSSARLEAFHPQQTRCSIIWPGLPRSVVTLSGPAIGLYPPVSGSDVARRGHAGVSPTAACQEWRLDPKVVRLDDQQSGQ